MNFNRERNIFMKALFAALITTLVGIFFAAQPATSAPSEKPTVVLVHGAFADSSSWYQVVGILEHDGYRVVALANPLRGVKSDGAYVHAFLSTIKTPVVLVGHSYG